MDVTWSQVVARRLARHGFTEQVPLAALGAQVGVMCGAHAQIITAAEWSIALRVGGATRADIADALWSDHSLIKTYGPRGTVHLIAAADLAMWAGALSAVPSASANLPPGVRLSDEQIDAITDAIADALADAELTTDELTAAIIDRVGPWAGEKVMPAFNDLWPRWRQMTDTAARRGVLCFGPARGRKVTYTNPRRWLPAFAPMGQDAALADIVKRYLYAYGPAAPQHVAQWLAAPKRWASDLFASLSDTLERITVDGREAWVVAGDIEFPDAPPSGLRLLPYFDAYAVGSHPRELLFPGRASERALAGGQAGAYPVLLIDGVVAGVWHQRRQGKHMDITVEPLVDLSAAQRGQLEQQARHVASFFGASPRLTIGQITVGPHA
jgi:hypothetical protein